MYPQKLITPCILCGCPEDGIVLDPFMGAGTTAVAAKKLGRKYAGCEINPEHVRMAERGIAEINPLFDREAC
jgi:DNA modification methylase